MSVRELAKDPSPPPTPTLSHSQDMWLGPGNLPFRTEASLLPVEDALLAPWLPHPSAVGVFCWRGWELESPEEPEGGPGCKIRLGYLSVLGVGHGRGLLTDMYNAHLTKVLGLGTACLSLRPFPGGHW